MIPGCIVWQFVGGLPFFGWRRELTRLVITNSFSWRLHVACCARHAMHSMDTFQQWDQKALERFDDHGAEITFYRQTMIQCIVGCCLHLLLHGMKGIMQIVSDIKYVSSSKLKFYVFICYVYRYFRHILFYFPQWSVRRLFTLLLIGIAVLYVLFVLISYRVIYLPRYLLPVRLSITSLPLRLFVRVVCPINSKG